MLKSALPAFATLGDMLKYLRRRARLTQLELSIAVGYSNSQISRLEQNERQVDAATLLALFVPALELEDQPELVNSLLAFAAAPSSNDEVSTPDAARAEYLRQFSSLEIPRLSNLPLQLTPFVGRARELAELEELLASADRPLITIVGPGGCGKTRLALEVARRQCNGVVDFGASYAHGVYFVALAPLSAATQILPALAEATGFRLESGASGRTQREQLLDYLRQKQMLLVLDNFEHLLDGVMLLADMVQSAPGVQLLMTSREPLRLSGEQLYPLHGLDFGPFSGTDATNLPDALAFFVQCSQRAIPRLTFSVEEFRDIEDICRLVEAMPLAIEMAAAWINTLSPAEILQEIRTNLNFLASKERGVAERHQSMRAVFDTTWQRLSDSEQQVFAALSVFRGGFTRASAQVVAGATLHHLSTLSDKSIIHYDRGQGRYTLLEFPRQYGALRLADQPSFEKAVQDRHSAHYGALLQKHQEALKGKEQQAALAALDAEQENLIKAWRWSVAQACVEEIGKTINGLGLYCQLRYLAQEGQGLFRLASEALAQVSEMRLMAHALAWQAAFSIVLQEFAQAFLLLNHSMEIINSPQMAAQDLRFERAFALLQLGTLAGIQHNLADHVYCLESIALFEELNDAWFTAQGLMTLADILHSMGDYGGQKLRVQQALMLYKRLGNEQGAATALSMLSDSRSFTGDPVSGLAGNLESLAVFRRLKNPTGVGICLRRIGFAHLALGESDLARQAQLESLAIFGELGDRPAESLACHLLTCVEMAGGDYQQAYSYAKRSLHIVEMAGNYSHLLKGSYSVSLGWATLYMGAFQDALHILQEAVAILDSCGGAGDLSWAYGLLGLAEWRGNLGQQARLHCLQGLSLGLQSKAALMVVPALSTAMLILAESHETQRSVELYALLRNNPYCRSGAWWRQTVECPMQAVMAGLPAATVEAALCRGESLDLWETIASLLDELQRLEEIN